MQEEYELDELKQGAEDINKRPAQGMKHVAASGNF